MRPYPASAAVLLVVLLTTASNSLFAGQVFTTVINIPPDPDIENTEAIGSNTQLNLFDGGTLGLSFDAGAEFGTENIEVNVYGGTVENLFYAGKGSIVNLFGGNPIGLYAAGGDSVTNIYGGGIGNLAGSHSESTVNLFGGSIGRSFDAQGNSTVNIYGGTVGTQFSAFSNSVINIFGGAIGDDFNAVQDNSVHLYGRQFFLAGIEISETMVLGVPRTIVERTVRLEGLLADGSPFDIDLNSGINYFGQDFVNESVMLTVTLVPEPTSLGSAALALLCASWQSRRPRRRSPGARVN